MPSIKRKLRTFLFKKMGPKPTERKEIDFSFVPSAHEEFRAETTRKQMSLNRREMRIDDNITQIKKDLLKMRMENGELMSRCNRLDSDIDQEQIAKVSVNNKYLTPLDCQFGGDDFDDFTDLSICSDDEIDGDMSVFPTSISCRPRLETLASNTESTSTKSSFEMEEKSEDSSPLTDVSDVNSISSDQSLVKDSSLDDTPIHTLNRQFYRAPKTIPNSTIHISSGKSFSENDCPPVLNRYSLFLPERPHSAFLDYLHSSQRHIAYNKINLPQLLHTNSESILEQSFKKPKSFATEVFDEVRKSIGDLSVNKNSA